MNFNYSHYFLQRIEALAVTFWVVMAHSAIIFSTEMILLKMLQLHPLTKLLQQLTCLYLLIACRANNVLTFLHQHPEQMDISLN
jgi:hypothetical protein